MPQNDHFTFGPQICGTLSPEAGAGREWLLADGLGGYASGTVSGLRTRREHTLLTVDDHGTRWAALACLDLTVTLPSGAKVALATHEWESGAVAPGGHRHLESFTLDRGLPRWRWRIGDVVIERELALRHGHPSLAVRDRVVAAPAPVTLAASAMCTWRDAHASRHAGGPPITTVPAAGGAIVAGAYRLTGPGWQPAGVWHYGVRTREDGAVEDLWLAGTFCRRAAPGESLEISAWAGDLAEEPPPPPVVLAAERERAHRLVTAAKAEGYGESLALAADKFVIRAADGPDVVAGYPLLGRDLAATMAAYEGLFLDTGRAEEGRELLVARTRTAAGAAGSPDASLWLVHAVDRHVTRTGDSDLAAELAAPLGRLMRQRLSGPGPLALDPADGLLRAGAGFTPDDRQLGKPVDVNALWVNALAAMGDLLTEGGYDDGEPRARHARARTSFLAAFPAPEGWLHDVVEGPPATYPLGAGAHTDDPSLRPNQLLAWSLPHGPMRGQDGAAVRAIGSALLTPLGLRTLAENEYGYRGDPAGGPADGAVLPWLIGPYADACRATGRPVEGLLTGLEAHLAEWGVGSISERADGEPPHRAAGCPFAARPVAEMLRVRGGLE
ncbi:glycogen debranching enzyme N-terminal domain-containing protein [Actinoplanes sp. NPDC023714]|uniref:glycogen debranching enzyme N-terminal domain-containing protein n=1 Tax=Actinoplanes sp. NPDC023714 TaxID=3154322 RepID=UPI0033E79971